MVRSTILRCIAVKLWTLFIVLCCMLPEISWAETWGGIRSGLPWMSGASVGMDPIERLRGRPLDARTAFFSITSWEALAASTGGISRINVPGSKLILAVGMLPKNYAGQHAQCAAGAFDSQIRTIAERIVASGGQSAIIRLGWEANRIRGYPWAVTDDGSSYKQCFRRWVSILRSVPNQTFIIDWNMAQTGTFAYHVDRMYPGNDVVDVIGAQQYDRCPPVRTEDDWRNRYMEVRKGTGSPVGLGRWLEYAKSKAKRLSIPEWGVGGPRNLCGRPGFDNPFFIGKMYEFFKINASNIAYESYFNGDDGSGDDENGSHRLAPSTYNPLSSARYSELWRMPTNPPAGIIHISRAFYYGSSNMCDATNALTSLCNGRSNCSISVSNSLCGDPEPSVMKRLAAIYTCRSEERSFDEAEGDMVNIQCQ